MFGVNSINVNVQWLGVLAPLRTNVTLWDNNILAPSPAWRTGGTDNNPNWVRQPGGHYYSVSVLWSGPVRAIPDYVHRSPENMRSAVCRVREDLLQDNHTARMQIISTSRSILRNFLVNWQDFDWDDLLDESVDQ